MNYGFEVVVGAMNNFNLFFSVGSSAILVRMIIKLVPVRLIVFALIFMEEKKF